MTAWEKEYGEALYELCKEENCAQEVLEQLDMVRALFQAEPKYPKILQDPALQKAERLAMLDEAFRGSVHPYLLNFLKLLCERSAVEALPGCADQFRTMYNEERGLLPVTATSAVALTEGQKQALMEKLSKLTGKTILLDNRVDPSLMGGIKVNYDGKELDGSVAGRLEALRRILTDGKA